MERLYKWDEESTDAQRQQAGAINLALIATTPEQTRNANGSVAREDNGQCVVHLQAGHSTATRHKTGPQEV